MLRPGLYTLGADERGQQALHLLPAEAETGDVILVHGTGLRHTDAWTATAFKTAVEYHCTALDNDFDLEPPRGAGATRAAERFFDLLGLMPSRFHLTDGHTLSPGATRAALLPALPVLDAVDAANAAETTLYRASAHGRRIAGIVATAVAVFTDNSLTHAPTSPVGVVTTVAFEPLSRTIQIVSSDLGPDLTAPDDAAAFLDAVCKKASVSHTNLAHLVESATRSGVAVTLTLASGPARLRWTGAEVSSQTTFTVPGFTAALTVSVE